MTFIRWKPGPDVARWTPVNNLAAEFLNFRNDCDTAVERRWGDGLGDVHAAVFRPKTDVAEDESGFTIRVELPGVARENIKITTTDRILSIRGEKKPEAQVPNGESRNNERSYGSFERSFTLPSTVSPETIAATYANGLLTVNIPRAEHSKQREIEVAVG